MTINTCPCVEEFFRQSRGAVRVQVSDWQERLFYDEFEVVARYRQHFDLSSLPAGTYQTI